MALTLLRKGFDWRIISLIVGQGAADLFKQMAKAHGSEAIWLTQTGVVCTPNQMEQTRNLPYEDWRGQVLKALHA